MPTRTSISNTALTFTTVESGTTDFIETRTTGKNHSRAIFGFGVTAGGETNVTNLVNVFGNVSLDTSTSGAARYYLAAAGYGGDRAIFGFGYESVTPTLFNTTILISNVGAYVSESSGTGTARYGLAAATYGGDKAIFGFGFTGSKTTITNLVSNIGVVAVNNTNASANARYELAAASYGGDKVIFGFGRHSTVHASRLSVTTLMSNVGVFVSEATNASANARYGLAATTYGFDKAIFGYGITGTSTAVNTSVTNLISNLGIVASDTAGVGTTRRYLAASGYGLDRAIFGYGATGTVTASSITNLVSNVGVVSTDTTGIGTARSYLAAAGWG
jgi:PII-like signaling protein